MNARGKKARTRILERVASEPDEEGETVEPEKEEAGFKTIRCEPMETELSKEILEASDAEELGPISDASQAVVRKRNLHQMARYKLNVAASPENAEAKCGLIAAASLKRGHELPMVGRLCVR